MTATVELRIILRGMIKRYDLFLKHSAVEQSEATIT